MARSKLNSIENNIYEALINNEISHEDFIAIINEKKTHQELKKAWEWSKFKEVILKKNMIEEGKKNKYWWNY